MNAFIEKLRSWARALKRQLALLWLCSREPDMPRAVKLLALAVLAYALSPLDLIPDFIPVLGLLDDLLLLPLGIALALRLTPPELRARCAPAAEALARAPLPATLRWLAAALVVLLWALLVGWLVARCIGLVGVVG